MGTTTTALVCLVAGMIGGIVSSAPIGPINLWVADATLRGQDRTLTGFLGGVILCDVAYAALAAWGYHAVAQDGRTAAWLSLLAGGVLIVLGLVMTARAGAEQRPAPGRPAPFTPARHFLLGTIMMGGNPAFLMFWVFVVDLVSWQIGGPIRSGLLVPLLAGVIIGDALWFAFLTRLVRSGSALLGAVARPRFERVLALGFVAAGIYSIMHGLSPLG
jgi:threonine/homoserine/homoserine lactone efflux protein